MFYFMPYLLSLPAAGATGWMMGDLFGYWGLIPTVLCAVFYGIVDLLRIYVYVFQLCYLRHKPFYMIAA